jgi:hypothetical protein
MTQATIKQLTGWGGLLTGLLGIWLFMFVIAPACKQIDAVETYTSFVRESEINASALWWSEVEETATAEMGARAAVEYTPRPFDDGTK